MSDCVSILFKKWEHFVFIGFFGEYHTNLRVKYFIFPKKHNFRQTLFFRRCNDITHVSSEELRRFFKSIQLIMINLGCWRIIFSHPTIVVACGRTLKIISALPKGNNFFAKRFEFHNSFLPSTSTRWHSSTPLLKSVVKSLMRWFSWDLASWEFTQAL